MRLGMAAALFLASHSAFGQQMSGAVTIDAAASPSTSNFQNWYSFWRSLQGLSRTDGGSTMTAGISSAVTVTVKSSLTESSQIQFPAITGMSSTNTITIDGGSNFVAFAGASGNPEVINFTGGDYFTIKNLTIRNTDTSAANAIGVRFSS